MDTVDLEIKFPELQPEVLEIADQVLELIMRIFPDAVVSEDEDNIGFGFGSGYKELVFIIAPQSNWVKLGIVNGAVLDDPKSLMEGKGKIHRHVKLHQLEQAQHPDFEHLMLRALQAAQKQIR
ncbi:MAG TPA: hypothetical protein VMW34_06620 [Anaerolineales bacterium]|nr:hypothetical protein [Anaerolineales bacterium]